MRASCYILYSEKLNRFYIGATTEIVDERLIKHNNAIYGKHRFTAKAEDWKVYMSIEIDDFAHAIRLERKIKSMKSSNYIRNLKTYPGLVAKIIEETKSI